ncbi:hypothetical protein IC617_08640 [Neiella sp. HB171785]|uniref:Uncharacterized protein n=1 Tax=Neiella litorisoli TaxID=2771431 RepID=A0A8J6UIZ0_9GAMM|nr:hypothetical protein [Neiella litorisoli]MBD1389493.1 hypothetical protein [Neiella litorisoli]
MTMPCVIQSKKLQLQVQLIKAVEFGLVSSVLREYHAFANKKALAVFMSCVEPATSDEGRRTKSNSTGFSWMKSTLGLFCATVICQMYAQCTDEHKRWDRLELADLLRVTDAFRRKYPTYFRMPDDPKTAENIIDINRIYACLRHGMMGAKFSIEKCDTHGCDVKYVSVATFSRKKCPMCLMKAKIKPQDEVVDGSAPALVAVSA